MRFITGFLFILLHFSTVLHGQLLKDDFNQASLDPTWQGGNTVDRSLGFTLNASGQLQSALPYGGTSIRKGYLSKPVTIPDLNLSVMEWQIKVKLDFTVSSSLYEKNHARVYLISNQADLNGPLQGYFLKVGDCIAVYKQDADKEELLAEGTSSIGTSEVAIRVERNKAGTWRVYLNEQLEISYTDNSFWVSIHMGIQIRYSSNSRRNSFYFDDFIVLRKPYLTALSVSSSNTLALHFSEWLEEASSIQTENFRTEPENPLVQVLVKGSEIQLTFENSFEPGQKTTLEIAGVSDKEGNHISPEWPLYTAFTYFLPDITPPQLLGVETIATDQLAVHFDEVLSESSATSSQHYHIYPGSLKPDRVVLSESGSEVILSFKEAFQVDRVYQLATWQISDTLGNQSDDTLRYIFTFEDRFPPEVDSVVVDSENSLQVVFSEWVAEGPASQPAYYLLDGQFHPVKVIGNPEAPQEVFLFFSEEIPPNKSIELRISSIEDQKGNIMESPVIRQVERDTKRPRLEEIHIESSKHLILYFSENIDKVSAEILNHYQLQPSENHPEYVKRDALDFSKVHLYFEDSLEYEKDYSLRVSQVEDCYGNNMYNSTKTFVYDVKAPNVKGYERLDTHTIQLQFSEKITLRSAQVKEHYYINTPFAPPDSLLLNTVTQKDLLLYWQEKFVEESTFRLSLTALEDLSGNVLRDTLTFPFSTSSLSIAKLNVLSPKKVEVQFTEDVNSTNLEARQFLLGGKWVPDSVQAYQDTLSDRLHLFFHETFPEKEPLLLEAWHMENMNGKQTEYLSGTLIYHSGIREIYVKTAFQLNIHLEKLPEGKTLKPSLFELGQEMIHPDTVFFNADEPSLLHLIFAEALIADSVYSLQILPFSAADWTVVPGSKHLVSLDKQAPRIATIEVLSLQEIEVHFNESLQEKFAKAFNHYQVGGQFPAEVVWQEETPWKVCLKFDKPWKEGQAYMLEVMNQKDLSGNLLVVEEFTFEVPLVPGWGSLSITEIMADPLPSQGLPGFEYLELRNTTGNTLSLEEYFLIFGEKEIALPKVDLPAGEAAIVCAQEYREDFTPYGTVLGISLWPGLSNSGQQLAIRNCYEELVFEVAYEAAWYQDLERSGGGFSLEMRDLDFPCALRNNWQASQAPLGGTPGQHNSHLVQLSDKRGPHLINAMAQDSLNLQLLFDEKLEPVSIAYAQFQIQPEIHVDSLSMDELNRSQVFLKLQSPLAKGQVYSIVVKNVRDCVGNTLHEAESRYFSLPQPAGSTDILLSEILFNPENGGVDFVELVNVSDKYIDLKNWQLANGHEGIIQDANPISGETRVLAPGSFLLLTSDMYQLQNQYPSASDSTWYSMALPAFSDTEGAVVLLNPHNQIVQWLDYHENMHHTLLEDVEGVSLERISYQEPENEAHNWTSASANVGYASPGYANSQSWENEGQVNSTDYFRLSPQVVSPDADGYRDFVNLEYQIPRAGWIASVTIFDAMGKEVCCLAKNETLGTSGVFRWEGVDSTGRKVRWGSYLVYIELFDLSGQVKKWMKEVVVYGN
ncbi:Ig-like domain-containing protein [Rapidithrix thailandica]|uniref:Ig-like domain-containing protein n=1 Tax=Rapidithrix thailandica TaxID=413964 RepID=A0AAW9SBB5_9BACT